MRRLYVQGKAVNGAGINASFAVEQDIDGRATDIALGWSVALGSPYTFQTTLESEYKSDIFGERGILLGAVHGIIESLYRRYVSQGMSKRGRLPALGRGDHRPDLTHHLQAGHHGRLRGGSAPTARPEFEAAYAAAYPAAQRAAGRDLRRGLERQRDPQRRPGRRAPQDSTRWARSTAPRRGRSAQKVRAKRVEDEIPLDPFTAGVYIATMMAQIDILLEHGHPYSEVANESVIECGRLAQPLHARPRRRLHGRQLLDDGAPGLAQVGAALRLRAHASRPTCALDDKQPLDESLVAAFKEHEIHEVLAECAKLRPSVDIFVE